MISILYVTRNTFKYYRS